MKELSFQKVWHDLINVLDREKVIYTLARRRSNRITDIGNEGIWVMTEKSSPNSELVPKWMFETAITHLFERNALLNTALLDELHVMRSSFVMAALSRLDYVRHETNPLQIFLIN